MNGSRRRSVWRDVASPPVVGSPREDANGRGKQQPPPPAYRFGNVSLDVRLRWALALRDARGHEAQGADNPGHGQRIEFGVHGQEQ